LDWVCIFVVFIVCFWGLVVILSYCVCPGAVCLARGDLPSFGQQ
jgi:hypothetical protein